MSGSTNIGESSEKRFCCTECDFQTGSRDEFRVHYVSHTSEGSFFVNGQNNPNLAGSSSASAEASTQKKLKPIPPLIPIETPGPAPDIPVSVCPVPEVPVDGIPARSAPITESAPIEAPAVLKEEVRPEEDDVIVLKECSGSVKVPPKPTQPKQRDMADEARSTLKKVYVCPYCRLWVATLTRFHAHIMEHIGEKAFGCSACSYQSKWSWDVTTHIGQQENKHRAADIVMTTVTNVSALDEYDQYVITTSSDAPDEDVGKERVITAKNAKELKKLIAMGNSEREEPRPAEPGRASGSVSRSVPIRPKPPPGTVTALPTASTVSAVPVHSVVVNGVGGGSHSASKVDFPTGIRGSIRISPNVGNVSAKPSSSQAADSDDPVVIAVTKIASLRTESPKGPFPHAQSVPVANGVTAVASEADSTAEVVPKVENIPKPKLFKCKKCDYRNPDRGTVLEHIRTHYLAKYPGEKRAKIIPTKAALDAYECGHCGLKSNWKHIILRHCDTVHSGNINLVDHVLHTVQKGPMSEKKAYIARRVNGSTRRNGLAVRDPKASKYSPAEQLTKHRCYRCPYTGPTWTDLQTHLAFHREQPGAHKCKFCTFASPNERDVEVHLALHGVEVREEVVDGEASLADSGAEGDAPEVAATAVVEQVPDVLPPLSGDDVAVKKKRSLHGRTRYLCPDCPFSSKNKSQFTHHVSFHRPIPGVRCFKCDVCSYNVTRRHLLIQHQKVHAPGSETEIQSETETEAEAVRVRQEAPEDQADDLLPALPGRVPVRARREAAPALPQRPGGRRRRRAPVPLRPLLLRHAPAEVHELPRARAYGGTGGEAEEAHGSGPREHQAAASGGAAEEAARAVSPAFRSREPETGGDQKRERARRGSRGRRGRRRIRI